MDLLKYNHDDGKVSQIILSIQGHLEQMRNNALLALLIVWPTVYFNVLFEFNVVNIYLSFSFVTQLHLLIFSYLRRCNKKFTLKTTC